MKTKTSKQTTASRISEARLARLTHQNEKLALELKKLKGQVVDIDQHIANVRRANVVVKTQFLALGPRLASRLASLTDPRDISQLITSEVEKICSDLAYEETYKNQPDICPMCGGRKEEAL
jgi:hypothetical protein